MSELLIILVVTLGWIVLFIVEWCYTPNYMDKFDALADAGVVATVQLLLAIAIGIGGAHIIL